MNREILFRGKRADNAEWIQGFLIAEPVIPEKCHIMYFFDDVFIGPVPYKIEVIPGTVSQYTGLRDRNDTMIFEGDILRGYENGNPIGLSDVVTFEYGCFRFKNTPDTLITYAYPMSAKQCEVIGNIHDNPELLTS